MGGDCFNGFILQCVITRTKCFGSCKVSDDGCIWIIFKLTIALATLISIILLHSITIFYMMLFANLNMGKSIHVIMELGYWYIVIVGNRSISQYTTFHCMHELIRQHRFTVPTWSSLKAFMLCMTSEFVILWISRQVNHMVLCCWSTAYEKTW